LYLSKSNIKELRYAVEGQSGFQVALVPMQSNTFLNVKIATDELYKKLMTKGVCVLVDDRNEKPKNKFEVISFLKIQHRIVISSRSISAGVFEYKDLESNDFRKIPEREIIDFLIEVTV
jgi:prolyl-tRNA synthetase